MTVTIFANTTSELAEEFVDCFPSEKLDLLLIRVGQETGVEISREKSSFNVTGHWRSLLKVYSSLENALDAQFADNQSDVINCHINELKTKKPNVFGGKRGRKPGSTVRQRTENSVAGVPEPIIFQNKKSMVKSDLMKPSNFLSVIDGIEDEIEAVKKIYGHNAAMGKNIKTDPDPETEKDASVMDTQRISEEITKNIFDMEHNVQDDNFYDYTNHINEQFVIEVNDPKQRKEMLTVNNQLLADKKNETDTISTSHLRKIKKFNCSKRGRKPGSTVGQRTENTDVPKPIVFQNNDNSMMKSDLMKPSNFLSAIDGIEDEAEAMKKIKYSHNIALERIIKTEKDWDAQTISEDLTENVSDHEHNVQDDNFNDDTDNDEQFEDDDTEQRKEMLTVTNHEDDAEYRCNLCSYVGNKKENLKEHKQRNHGNKFECDQCSKQFGLNRDLTKHKKRVHSEAAHICHVCAKSYKDRRHLDKHVLTHKESYVKPNFACEMCEKSFSTKYVLAAHIKAEHLGMKKSFQCPTCGKSFTQKSSYLMHANVHAGIKPYVCDVCGKAFTYNTALREHKFMHDSKERFQCHRCSKTFLQRTGLSVHMKVHQDTKDYMCKFCGIGFTQQGSLARHERIHSGEKPYNCGICSEKFSDHSVIRRHMMLVHKKDPKNWQNDIISLLIYE